MVRLDNRKDFDQVWKLMLLSFPDNELRLREQHETLLDNPAYVIYGEREGERLKAFIATYTIEDFLFVDYFAADPEFRGQGLGHRMLEELLAMTDRNVVLEIEVPSDELTIRRKMFYERNGFILSEFPYEVPPVCRGNGPVHLSIMSSRPITSLSEFQRIRDAVIEYTYTPFL